MRDYIKELSDIVGGDKALEIGNPDGGRMSPTEKIWHVYLLVNPDGVPCYVGMTGNVRSRRSDHIRKGRKDLELVIIGSYWFKRHAMHCEKIAMRACLDMGLSLQNIETPFGRVGPWDQPKEGGYIGDIRNEATRFEGAGYTWNWHVMPHWVAELIVNEQMTRDNVRLVSDAFWLTQCQFCKSLPFSDDDELIEDLCACEPVEDYIARHPHVTWWTQRQYYKVRGSIERAYKYRGQDIREFYLMIKHNIERKEKEIERDNLLDTIIGHLKADLSSSDLITAVSSAVSTAQKKEAPTMADLIELAKKRAKCQSWRG